MPFLAARHQVLLRKMAYVSQSKSSPKCLRLLLRRMMRLQRTRVQPSFAQLPSMHLMVRPPIYYFISISATSTREPLSYIPVGIKTVLKQNMKGDWELYTQSHDKKNVPKKLLDAVLKHLLLENTTDENKISINSHIRYLGSQARDESTRNCHTKHITAARSTYCSIYICWLDYESHHLTIDVFFFFVKDRGSC